MKGKSNHTAIIVVFLILGSIMVIDIVIDLVPRAEGAVREVGPGKTYSTIQEGIDAANPGDTVFVYNGTYNESFTISKTINLMGENNNSVILDGKGATWAILINTNYVNISGMSITNATWGIDAISGYNTEISDMILFNNSIGIRMEDTSYCNLFNNIIYNSSNIGISGKNINNCLISFNNIFNNAETGIHVNLDSYNNLISNNIVYNNSFNGIYLNQGPYTNVIENNTAFNNGYIGIRGDQGTSYNQFINNTCYNNGNSGLAIQGGTYNLIKNNQVFGSSFNLEMSGADNNTILNNLFSDGTFGTYFLNSDYNYVTNNRFLNNTNEGIVFKNSHDNIFNNSTLENNSNNIECTFQSRDNIVLNSTLSMPKNKEIVMSQSTRLTLLNTTFDKDNISIFDSESRLSVQWFLHVKVLYPNLTPAKGVRFRITDSDNGSFRQTYQSWYDGYKKWLVVTEYEQSFFGKIYYSPYNISVWNRSSTAYEETSMEFSQTVTLTLGDPVVYKKLYRGWNLVSIPMFTTNSSIPFVLSSISGKYDTVQFYNSTDKLWHIYPTGDLTDINPTMGFWIHMKENAVLGVSGTLPIRVSITLLASGSGWNMIGYPTFYDNPVSNALESISGSYDAVQTFISMDAKDPWKHNNVNKPGEMNDLKDMNSGWGFWVHVNNLAQAEIGAKEITGVLSVTENMPGIYLGGLIFLNELCPIMDTEVVLYDFSLGEYANSDPIRSQETVQIGTQGVDMNYTFTDSNENGRVDSGDIMIVQNGAPGDTVAIINRLTGEVIAEVTLT